MIPIGMCSLYLQVRSSVLNYSGKNAPLDRWKDETEVLEKLLKPVTAGVTSPMAAVMVERQSSEKKRRSGGKAKVRNFLLFRVGF